MNLRARATWMWALNGLTLTSIGCGLTDLGRAKFSRLVDDNVEDVKKAGTVQAEKNLQKKVEPGIERQTRPANPTIAGYVKEVWAPLVKAAAKDSGGRKLGIKIIDDWQRANAFEIPGGTVYVYSGLLLEVASRDELAGILAHELGHAVKGHAMERLIEVMGSTAVLTAAGVDLAKKGDSKRVVAEISAGFVGGGAVAVRSRQQELAADGIALKYTRAAGFQPGGLAQFLSRRAAADPTPAMSILLSTHPSTESRIKRLEEMFTRPKAEAPPLAPVAAAPDPGLEKIKDEIRTKAIAAAEQPASPATTAAAKPAPPSLPAPPAPTLTPAAASR